MSPEVEERIRGYRPRRERAYCWDAIRPLVMELAVLSDPPSVKNASATMSAVTGYVLWAKSKRIPLVAENLADYNVIDWHLTEAGYIPSTEATYRSALDRMVAASRSGPAKGGRRPVLPPYTPAEQDQLLALVRFQPTASSAVRLEGMLAAGLGAGVTPAELRFLRPGHVIRRDGLVTVLAGDPPREVAVLSAYAERLWVAARRAESLGLSFLVTGGGSPDNPSALSQFVADINGSDQAPRLVASRLRTSWLVAHLRAGTPLGVLLPAAGEVSIARLAELLSHVEDVPPPEAASLLANADVSSPSASRPQERRP